MGRVSFSLTVASGLPSALMTMIGRDGILAVGHVGELGAAADGGQALGELVGADGRRNFIEHDGRAVGVGAHVAHGKILVIGLGEGLVERAGGDRHEEALVHHVADVIEGAVL